MGREENAALQKLELAQAAEREIAETRREARLARERLAAAAAALTAPLGFALPEAGSMEPPPIPEERASEPQPSPGEAPDFADIAARIAGSDEFRGHPCSSS